MIQDTKYSWGTSFGRAKQLFRLMFLLGTICGANSIQAATFPGTAYLSASDPTGALSWNTGTPQ